MTNLKTFNLTQAAAYIGVQYQAVQQRFGDRYNNAPVGEKPRHAIPLHVLTAWQKERIANAKAKLAQVSK